MAEKTQDIVATIHVAENKQGGRAAIVDVPFVRPSAAVFPSTKAPTPTRELPLTIPKEEANGYEWANWGDADNFPNRIEDKIHSVATAGQTLLQNAMALVGNGIVYCDEKEKTLPISARTPIYKEEVEQFNEYNDIHTTILTAALQALTHWNLFPIYTFDGDKSKIVRIELHPVPFHRVTRQDPATLRNNFVLISPRFGTKWGMPRKEEIVAVPLLNRFDTGFFERLSGYRFARHIILPSLSYIYYAKPPFAALFEDDNWIDIAANVPKLIKAMQDNQMRIKYVIKISEEYFRLRYSSQTEPEHNWDNMSKDAQRDIITKKIGELETALTDPKNAGKAISYVFQDAYNKDDVQKGHIYIEAIDDKLKRGDWVTDINEANQQIVSGLGGSTSRFGLSTSKNAMGAGSGSNLMQDRNIEISTNTTLQMFVLDFLNYAYKLNGFGVYAYINDMQLTTQDKSRGGFVTE